MSVQNNLHEQLEWFNRHKPQSLERLERERNGRFEFATQQEINEYCPNAHERWNKLSTNIAWGSHINIGKTKQITKQPE